MSLFLFLNRRIEITIQHRLIPNSELHEPKDVATATTKQIYFADGLGSGDWRRISPIEIDNSVKANNINGWNDIADSLYTSGSPRAISSGVRTQLTNNASAAQTDITRLGALWSTASNQFLIDDLNAMYSLRVSLKATAAAAAGTPYILTIELESASGSTVIIGSTKTIKGGGAINQVTETMIFYNGAFINNAALKVFVTPDTNINIYDIGFVIQRTYKET